MMSFTPASTLTIGDDDDRAQTGSAACQSIAPTIEGVTVGHATNHSATVYGGRDCCGGTVRHMDNTEPGERGWLGNPFEIGETATADERRHAIGEFAEYFVERIEHDDELREAIEALRGRRVGCWCRGITEDRADDNWCHLDVIDAWLRHDLETVEAYLGGVDDQ